MIDQSFGTIRVKYTSMKDKFCEILRSTGREGVETVIGNLEKLGFFKAPASTVFHLSCEGGLVQHSLNVCDMALMLRESMIARDSSLEEKLPLESVIVAALLHDVCKAEIYKEGFRNVKNEKTGEWEKVARYEVDYSYCPLGHGEKSVIRLLSWGSILLKMRYWPSAGTCPHGICRSKAMSRKGISMRQRTNARF